MYLKQALNIATGALLLTMMAASFPPALAQEEATGGTQAEPSQKEAETPAAAKTTADKKPARPVSNDSPFDYEASEEISQDLSVSFPVDI